ncbi:MAG: Fe-S cluster assembly ATPase SufC [Chlamydiae bacterium]|nr:Fe-S cluster assembly ATPase SufC [Chlamydiota bacterium]
MLIIDNLEVSVDDKKVLNGLSLKVGANEVHAIMGPNGAGKSSLSNVLAGHPSYQILGGSITFKDEDLLGMEPNIRALKGVFKSFQYPLEIAGLNTKNFLKESLNLHRKQKGLDGISDQDFQTLLEEKMDLVKFNPKLIERDLHANFSGGEKKKSEILQMALFEPSLAILDETDSGLDIDALKAVGQAIEKLRAKDRSIILITHYQRLLDFVQPDVVHVMQSGKIVRSGNSDLAKILEAQGYEGSC